MNRSPAALPAALFVVACAVAPSLRPTPIWATVALLAVALAHGGRGGCACAALAAGLLAGEGRRTAEPRQVAGRVAEAEGRICGRWNESAELSTRSVQLCADWLTVGGARLLAPPPLRLDLSAAGPAPAFGERIRARGTLSRFAGFANADATAPGPWRLRVKSTAFVRRIARAGAFARSNGALRARLEAAVAATGAAARPGVALARALVLGDESAFSEARRRALRRAGLAHLFAVSGFNLTLVAAFAALLAGAGGRVARAAWPAAAVLLYLAAVGPEPSMLRASVMSGCGLAILLLERWAAAAQTLALAAAALVAAQPAAVDDVGFQLSFGATAGLVLVARRWRAAMPTLPHAVATALATSCAAQAGALPFSVAAFGELAPLAPLWNLLAVPWAALWLLVGMIWLGVALVAPPAAAALAPALDLGALPFAAIERLPPSAWVSLPLGGGAAAGLAVALLFAIAFEWPRARRLLPLAAAALALAGGGRPPEASAEVAFLDVGQGDAALVRSGRFSALIDGGGLAGRDLGSAVLRPALARRGIARLTVAVLSHSDRDHCQGLLDLAAAVPIGELWSSPGQLARGCGARLAARLGGRTRALAAGDTVERDGVRFEVWHPTASRGAGSSNAESLVLAVDLGGRRFVFTGDVAAAEERQAVERASPRPATVLKAAHHGAASSTAAAALARLRPRLAVVSVGGRNAYGHPAPATMARLAAAGARILRTDRDGEIDFARAGSGPWRLSLPASPRRFGSGG